MNWKNIEIKQNWWVDWKQYLRDIYKWDQPLSKMSAVSEIFEKMIKDNPELKSQLTKLWENDINNAFDRLIKDLKSKS